MAVTTLKIAGRKYVLMPESEFMKKTSAKNGAAKRYAAKNGPLHDAPALRRLTRQDRGDIAESLRLLKHGKSLPYDQARLTLGL